MVGTANARTPACRLDRADTGTAGCFRESGTDGFYSSTRQSWNTVAPSPGTTPNVTAARRHRQVGVFLATCLGARPNGCPIDTTYPEVLKCVTAHNVICC